MAAFIDLTSKRFGSLVVVGESYIRHGVHYWSCDCDCGGKLVIAGKWLRNGKRNCGHCFKNTGIGQRFGKLIVQGPAPNGRYYCLCDCGKTTIAEEPSLKSGRRKSCGCARLDWTPPLEKTCTKCGKTKPRSEFYKHSNQNNTEVSGPCKSCLKIILNSAKKRRDRQARLDTINAYGGKCECCGETQWEFLTIDHINGGGNKHRKELGGSSGIFRWLKNNDYPAGYRVLCMNCNWAIGMLGYCPHHKPA